MSSGAHQPDGESGSCGCGQSFCCGKCVPAEEMERLIAEHAEKIEVTRCSPACTCGGIPNFLAKLDALD